MKGRASRVSADSRGSSDRTQSRVSFADHLPQRSRNRSQERDWIEVQILNFVIINYNYLLFYKVQVYLVFVFLSRNRHHWTMMTMWVWPVSEFGVKLWLRPSHQARRVRKAQKARKSLSQSLIDWNRWCRPTWSRTALYMSFFHSQPAILSQYFLYFTYSIAAYRKINIYSLFSFFPNPTLQISQT